jgi:hypothetical protein
VARRHHVVSRGYQRHWTNGGERIEHISKADLSSRAVGTGDAFVRPGFNAVLTDDGADEHLEDEWARLENLLLPIARDLMAGRSDAEDPLVATAIKSLIAVHWVRSFALQERILKDYLSHQAEAVAEWPAEPRLLDGFRQQYRRIPESGEIEGTIEGMFVRRRKSNEFFVEHMVSLYGQAMEYFMPCNVEVARIRGPLELVTGDSPVVLSDGIRVGQETGLGLLEADLVYMPLGPRTGVSLITGETREIDVYPLGVQMMNRLTWRNTRAYLAARPGSDWRRALAMSPGAPRSPVSGRGT